MSEITHRHQPVRKLHSRACIDKAALDVTRSMPEQALKNTDKHRRWIGTQRKSDIDDTRFKSRGELVKPVQPLNRRGQLISLTRSADAMLLSVVTNYHYAYAPIALQET